MKHIRKYQHQILGIILFILIMLSSSKAHSQNIVRDSAGNFYAITKPSDTFRLTKYFYYDSKGKYPVYLTSKGKFFVVVISKTGIPRKKYL